MTTDVERVRGAMLWRRSVANVATRPPDALGTMRCWFDLGAAVSILCMALMPAHPGWLVAISLFVLGRLLLVSWASDSENQSGEPGSTSDVQRPT